MSDTLSIKVQIAGRSYPLTIQRDEEEGIRRVAKEIDENVRTLGESYAVKDKQDLLAMTALQFGAKLAARSDEAGEEKSQKILTDLASFINGLETA